MQMLYFISENYNDVCHLDKSAYGFLQHTNRPIGYTNPRVLRLPEELTPLRYIIPKILYTIRWFTRSFLLLRALHSKRLHGRS